MSYSVKAINVGEYVMVRHEGELMLQHFEEAREAVKKLLDSNHWNRLLIDVRDAAHRVPTASS